MLAVLDATILAARVRFSNGWELIGGIAMILVIYFIWHWIKRGARAAATKGQEKVSASMQNRSAAKRAAAEQSPPHQN